MSLLCCSLFSFLERNLSLGTFSVSIFLLLVYSLYGSVLSSLYLLSLLNHFPTIHHSSGWKFWLTWGSKALLLYQDGHFYTKNQFRRYWGKSEVEKSLAYRQHWWLVLSPLVALSWIQLPQFRSTRNSTIWRTQGKCFTVKMREVKWARKDHLSLNVAIAL